MSGPAAGGGRVVLRGGTVFTMDRRQAVFSPGEVEVTGGRIAYVGPVRDGQGPPGPAGDAGPAGAGRPEVIDTSGKAVLPGFVNAHTHAAMNLFRTYANDLPLERWLEERIWPAERRLGPDDVYWGTLLAACEMLRSGITCFADMYFFMDQVARAVLAAGIRASLSPGLIGVLPGAEAGLEATREFAARWHGHQDRIRVMAGPHAPYTCPPPYLERVARLAADCGIGVHVHLAETRREVDACLAEHGVTPVALAHRAGLFERPCLVAHAVHVDPADMELLASSQAKTGGGGVAHCPVTNASQASGVAPVRAMLDAGVNVALGTDGPASTGPLDMFLHLRTAAYLQKVTRGDPAAFPAGLALDLATRAGAVATGWRDSLGSLEAGKAADVVVVNLRAPHLEPGHDPAATLVYCARPEDVDLVLVAGRTVVSQGRVLTVDEAEAMAECRRRGLRLVAG